MRALWAPWRMQYLSEQSEKKEVDTCVLCSLKRETSEETLVVHQGEFAYVVLNKFPYANGHLMVIPQRHVADFSELSPEEASESWSLCQSTIQVLKEIYKPHGFNVGFNMGKAAGAGIPDHLHFHVVPRWIGDTNFLPVLTDTKSLPGHLLASYRIIRKAFEGRFKR